MKKLYTCLVCVLLVLFSCTKSVSPTQAQLNANVLKSLSIKSITVIKWDYTAQLFYGDSMTIDGNGLATIHGAGGYTGDSRVYNLGMMKGYDMDTTYGSLTLYF